jgi:hypothetical protein
MRNLKVCTSTLFQNHPDIFDRVDVDIASLMDELREEIAEIEKQEKLFRKEKRQKEKQIISSLETELARY